MPLSRRTLWPLATLIVAGAWAMGCAAESDSPESTSADVAPIVKSQVHVVDAEPGSDLDVQPDTVSASLAKLGDFATYKPGDVIVSGRAGGLLRRVRATRVEGDRVIVDTEAASLEDVFQQVHLRGSMGEPPAAPATAGLAPRGVFLQLPKMHVDNKRLTIGNGSEIELVEGSFSFQPQLDFDLSVRDGRLDHLKVVASGETEGKLHVRYDIHKAPGLQSGAFVRFDNAGVPLVESAPYYAVFWAGYVPVVVAVRARLLANWGLEAGGDVFGEESVRAAGSLSAGLEYTNGGWRNVSSRGFSVSANGQPTIVSHSIAGNVMLTARLDVSFYEIAGPYVGLQAYAGVGHEESAAGASWFTDVGLRGIAGAQVAVFGKALVGYQSVLFDVHDRQPL